MKLFFAAFRLHFRKIYGWKIQGMMMMKKPATMDADDEDVDEDDNDDNNKQKQLAVSIHFSFKLKHVFWLLEMN